MDNSTAKYYILFLRFCKEEDIYMKFLREMYHIIKRWNKVYVLKDKPGLISTASVLSGTFIHPKITTKWQSLIFRLFDDEKKLLVK